MTGLVGNDSVTGLAEVYSDKNAGSSKTLSVSAYTITDGNSGNNYAVVTREQYHRPHHPGSPHDYGEDEHENLRRHHQCGSHAHGRRAWSAATP